MAGYVDKEVARQRKILADAVAGKGLRKAIRALQERSKVYDSFGEAKKRGSITSKHKVGRPVHHRVREPVSANVRLEYRSFPGLRP